MRRILLSSGVIAGLLAVIAQSVKSQPEPTKQASAAGQAAQDENKARPAVDHTAGEAAIRANIALFVKAYNAGDAKAVAALFIPDGVIVDKDGDESEGREAIAQTFGELFAANPEKRIEVTVESLRFIGADLAVEEGT